MSTFAFLFLCIQSCLIQNSCSACFGAGPAYGWGAGLATPCGLGIGSGGSYGVAPYPGAYGLAEPFGYAGYGGYGLAGPYGCATYGGAGAGNVAVEGALPVGGATAVTGQVPIIGVVDYAGPVCAAGTVIISGNCACGCGVPGYYGYGIY